MHLHRLFFMFVSPFCDGIPSGRLIWVKAPFGVVSILLLP